VWVGGGGVACSGGGLEVVTLGMEAACLDCDIVGSPCYLACCSSYSGRI
jgi:hypothetical protein